MAVSLMYGPIMGFTHERRLGGDKHESTGTHTRIPAGIDKSLSNF
jgi:hypothetical protein